MQDVGAHPQVNLVGYWPLQGDCLDHSGNANHGRNCGRGGGVDLRESRFNGQDNHILVPPSASLCLGREAFSLAAWVHTNAQVEGVIGDIAGKYDRRKRKGFTLCIKSSAGGYNSQGDDKHVYFGIDNARLGEWQDCGRPSLESNYVSNSLTVFDCRLYAGTTDARRFEDWCHVFRYEGGQNWADCGRAGSQKTRGVGPLIVHGCALYAATWSYDWRRVAVDDLDYCHVYRYAGGQEWQDCGQPGHNRRLFCLASYKGKLYVGGDDATGGTHKIFVYDEDSRWHIAGEFPTEGPRWLFPTAMGVHAGELYAGFPSVHCFDGEKWACVGTPVESTQVHSLEVYRGRLYAGTWPDGKIARYKGGTAWRDCGRPGDSTEVNALTVYNGALYAGSIPRAEVYRYEGREEWMRLARFHAPRDWQPVPVCSSSPEAVELSNEWTRVTSLTVYDGRLFASTGSCTSSILDAPLDVRGKVFSLEAGKCVSYDRDLGAGWHHVVAVRERGQLRLYLDGRAAGASEPFDGESYDLANDRPLTIGYGELGYFSGRIRDVRLYRNALGPEQVAALCDCSKAVAMP